VGSFCIKGLVFSYRVCYTFVLKEIPDMGQGNIKVIENDQRLDMKRRMADIRQMHRNISRITDNKDRTCLQYLDDFMGHISQLIVKLEIFPYHLVWECLYQEAPENIPVKDGYILLDVTPKVYRQTFLTGTDFFNYGRDKYLRVALSREEFSEKFVNYFAKGIPDKVFEIPVKPGYTYFNLPVFVGDESLPRWILTLLYREENRDVVAGEDFFPFMEHLSHEIGMAGEKFQEQAAAILMEQINYQLAWGKKTERDSGIEQLKIITRLLARQLQVDWCGIFLEIEQYNMLKLEAANMGRKLPSGVPLNLLNDSIVDSFKREKNYRLLGRENLEKTVIPEMMINFEKAIRKEKKQSKQNKFYFTPYVLFEHALFFPITFGNRKPGIITLFRAKNSHEPEPSPEKRFPLESRPFSAFETDLLKRIKRQIFYVFIAHEAVQRRMRDTRNMITQVVSPISALISSTRQYTGRAIPVERIDPGKISEILYYINALSVVANQYVTNFEKLLDIDTQRLEPRWEKIPDLRKYLIDISRLYLPLCRKKFIHINVTQQTPSDISLVVDIDLFEVVISNLIENAVKYSFDPEERKKYGLQYKPATMEDKENVLLTAELDENSVFITISNYGLEIPESDRGKIFDRDFRGKAAPDGGKGSGLGLYLAKEIIAVHNGYIEIVPNTPPHNTIVKVALPKGRNEKNG
jgi:signal transduction histidine kinase